MWALAPVDREQHLNSPRLVARSVGSTTAPPDSDAEVSGLALRRVQQNLDAPPTGHDGAKISEEQEDGKEAVVSINTVERHRAGIDVPEASPVYSACDFKFQ